jgi:hypothetical protein
MQGWARASYYGLGLLRAWHGLVCRLGAWTAGLAPKPGPRGLGLGILVYVVKDPSRRSGLGPLPGPSLFVS